MVFTVAVILKCHIENQVLPDKLLNTMSQIRSKTTPVEPAKRGKLTGWPGRKIPGLFGHLTAFAC